MLIGGRVLIELDDEPQPRVLEIPGEVQQIRKGQFVRYHLADENTSVLVLASMPYERRNEA